jgi:hypothetical protein
MNFVSTFADIEININNIRISISNDSCLNNWQTHVTLSLSLLSTLKNALKNYVNFLQTQNYDLLKDL